MILVHFPFFLFLFCNRPDQTYQCQVVSLKFNTNLIIIKTSQRGRTTANNNNGKSRTNVNHQSRKRHLQHLYLVTWMSCHFYFTILLVLYLLYCFILFGHVTDTDIYLHIYITLFARRNYNNKTINSTTFASIHHMDE